MGFWQSVSLEQETVYHWRIGLLDLWVQSFDGEWRVASRTGGGKHAFAGDRDDTHAPPVVAAAPTEGKPDELPWRRVLADRGGGEISVVPVMPSRSLVVRPESPLVLPHGAKASLYVSIPVWVRLVASAGDRIVIAEVPTVTLSNTWFGDPAAGELCYSLSTRARRSLAEGAPQPHRAICPVSIINNSARDLPFARLCLPVGTLAVYEGERQPATSAVEVTYHAEEQVARTRPVAGPPALAGVGRLLSEPRRPQRESVLSRSLTTIRSLTGL